jgi:hypothetical protein
MSNERVEPAQVLPQLTGAQINSLLGSMLGSLCLVASVEVVREQLTEYAQNRSFWVAMSDFKQSFYSKKPPAGEN